SRTIRFSRYRQADIFSRMRCPVGATHTLSLTAQDSASRKQTSGAYDESRITQRSSGPIAGPLLALTSASVASAGKLSFAVKPRLVSWLRRSINSCLKENQMDSVTVRYIVDDVDAAINFYTANLDFEVVMHPAPG